MFYRTTTLDIKTEVIKGTDILHWVFIDSENVGEINF